MTDISPRERLLARIAAVQATRARRIDLQAGLCALAVICATFAASSAGYVPVVDFNMVHRLNAGQGRDPLAIVGTLADVLAAAVAFLALAQNRLRPGLVAIASIAYCGYSLLSLSWGIFSIPAAGEGVKGIAFVLAIPFCIEVLGPRRAAECVFVTLLAIMLGSAFLCLSDKRFATDGYAVVHYEWRSASDVLGWRGMFVQKNWLAMGCLSTLLFQVITFRQFRRSPVYWFLGALVLFLLVESRGKTAEMVAVVSMGSLAILFFNRRYIKIDLPIVVTLTIGLIIAFVAACYSGMILKGFDWTFTGRTVIWQEYWKLGTQRPWFGYGAGGTWQEDEIFGEIRQNAKGMTSPHNAYLSMLFSGGIALIATFAFWLFAIMREVVSGIGDWYRRAVTFFAMVAGLLLAMFEAMFTPNIAVSFAAYILFFGLIYMREVRDSVPQQPAAPSPVGPRARIRRAPVAARTGGAATPVRRQSP